MSKNSIEHLNCYQEQFVLDNPNVTSGVLSRFIGCSTSQVANVRNKQARRKWFYKGIGLPFTSKSAEGRYMVNRIGVSLIATVSFKKAMGCVDRLIQCIEKEGFARVDYKYTEFKSVRRTARFKTNKEHRFAMPPVMAIARKSDFKR